MSFGFGVGDIATCLKLAHQAISSLRSAGSDFEGLRLELSSLTAALSALDAEARSPLPLFRTASVARQAEMAALLANCRTSMESLQDLVRDYGSLGVGQKKRLREWMRFAAKDKRGPSDKLAVHTASINMFLTTLSHGALVRLELLMRGGKRERYGGSELDGERGLRTAGVTRQEGVAWTQIGRELAEEGIRDVDVERFQEDIKAYARYLVRGETPFWLDRARRSSITSSDQGDLVVEYLVSELSLHGKRKELQQREYERLLKAAPQPRRYSEFVSDNDRSAVEERMKFRQCLRQELREANQDLNTSIMPVASPASTQTSIKLKGKSSRPENNLQMEDGVRKAAMDELRRNEGRLHLAEEGAKMEEESLISLAEKFACLFDLEKASRLDEDWRTKAEKERAWTQADQ